MATPSLIGTMGGNTRAAGFVSAVSAGTRTAGQYKENPYNMMGGVLDNAGRQAAIRRISGGAPGGGGAGDGASTINSAYNMVPSASVQYSDPYAPTNQSQYYSRRSLGNVKAYSAPDNSRYYQGGTQPIDYGTGYNPQDLSQYYSSDMKIDRGQSYSPQDLSRYYGSEVDVPISEDINAPDRQQYYGQDVVAGQIDPGRYRAMSTTEQQYGAKSDLTKSGESYLSGLYANPDQVAVPKDEQGRSWYDIASSELDRKASEATDARMKALQGRLARQGISGGAAEQIRGQAAAEIDKANTESQRALQQQRLQDVFGAQQAQRERLTNLGGQMAMSAEDRAVTEKVANLDAAMKAQGLDLDARAKNLDAQLQAAGINEDRRKTILSDLYQYTELGQKAREAATGARLTQAGLNIERSQNILQDIRGTEQLAQEDKWRGVDAQLAEYGLNQKDRELAINDVRNVEKMANDARAKEIDQRLAEAGLDIDNRKIILADLQGYAQLSQEDKWNNINARLEDMGLDQKNREMILNDLRTTEKMAEDSKNAQIEQMLTEKGLDNDARQAILDVSTKYAGLQTDERIARWDNDTKLALEELGQYFNLENKTFDQMLGDYKDLNKVKSDAAFNAGATGSPLPDGASELEVASYNAGKTGMALKDYEAYRDARIDATYAAVMNVDPDKDPKYLETIDNIFSRLGTNVRVPQAPQAPAVSQVPPGGTPGTPSSTAKRVSDTIGKIVVQKETTKSGEEFAVRKLGTKQVSTSDLKDPEAYKTFVSALSGTERDIDASKFDPSDTKVSGNSQYAESFVKVIPWIERATSLEYDNVEKSGDAYIKVGDKAVLLKYNYHNRVGDDSVSYTAIDPITGKQIAHVYTNSSDGNKKALKFTNSILSFGGKPTI